MVQHKQWIYQALELWVSEGVRGLEMHHLGTTWDRRHNRQGHLKGSHQKDLYVDFREWEQFRIRGLIYAPTMRWTALCDPLS